MRMHTASMNDPRTEPDTGHSRSYLGRAVHPPRVAHGREGAQAFSFCYAAARASIRRFLAKQISLHAKRRAQARQSRRIFSGYRARSTR